MNVAITHNSSAREMIVTLTRKGQVTIPAAVRQFLGLKTRSKVALVLDAQDQSVHLRVPRYPTIASVAGAAGSLNRKISWDEMLEIGRADALGKSTPKGDD